MSQRPSGYDRQPNDHYVTPEWVTEVLIQHIPQVVNGSVWEPAAGPHKAIANVLRGVGLNVLATDITDEYSPVDFLKVEKTSCVAIITNPPYNKSVSFITHALHLMREQQGFVAMLLRADFDHAKTRQNLFGDCPMFAKKIALTKRIRWFEDTAGSPSYNHAWFLWNWRHSGPPTIAYGP